MPKFRQNHTRHGKSSSSMMIRLVAFLVFVGFGLFYLYQTFQTSFDTVDDSIQSIPITDETGNPYFLPTGGTGDIIHHESYSLSYREEYEVAEWVAYELTKAQLLKPNLPRDKWYNEDKKVTTQSAKHSDYSHSGYTRGHLIPSADRSYDKTLMSETNFMSNITPQLEKFNGGIWNELENQVRNWAYDNGQIIVITGPILDTSITEYIGKNRIGVPQQFYKVILDLAGDQKSIGFILPHAKSDVSLQEYMVTVDEVEAATGLNFFNKLLSESLEKEVESSFDASLWPLDEELFYQRVHVWNQ